MKTRNANESIDKMISIPVVNLHAVGIDLGSKSHFVCIAQDKLKNIVKTLKNYGISKSELDLAMG